MRDSLVLLACLVALSASCKKADAPATQAHAVNLWVNTTRVGEEGATFTFEGQRVTVVMRTTTGAPLEAQLDGRLIVERGRATSLRVIGREPGSLPSLIDVTTTPDRTDVFPIRSPLPVHVLGALVRQAITAGKRQFQSLPDGLVEIMLCPGAEGPFGDATCHAVTGLPSGPALVWLNSRGQLAAAVARTAAGRLVATEPGRDASRPALLERFDVYSAP